MEGAQPSRPVHRRPANSPKGIYKPIDPRPKLPDAGHHHKPDDPRPKEPDAGHHHTPREQSVGTNHGGLFIQIDQDGNQRIVYPRSSLPRDKDVRPAHERGFYVPGNLNNEPLLCSARPGCSYFSSDFFEGILDKAKGPFISIAEQLNIYADRWDTAKGVYNDFSVGPGLFKHIGRDAKGLLFFDYNSDLLRLEPANKSNLVCGAGVTSAPNFLLRKLFFSLKHVNTAFDLNGTLNNNLLAKISFDGVLGANTRGVLYLPLPSFKSKFEFQAFRRFAGITAGIGTGIRPCPEVSCLLGVKQFSFGGSVKYDPTISEWISSGGISVQIPNASIGLTVNQDMIATATVHRSYPKWRTSFGILASFGLGGPFFPLVPYFGGPSYCPVPRSVPRHHVPRRVEEENDPVPRRIEDSAIIVGVSHQLNDQILLKSRVSSDGVASVLVKLTFWGVFSVAASTDVDIFDFYRVPSAGLVLSVH